MKQNWLSLALQFKTFFKSESKNPFLQISTAQMELLHDTNIYSYIMVQYNRISDRAQPWQRYNIDYTSNSQKTHMAHSNMLTGKLWDVCFEYFGENWLIIVGLHCISVFWLIRYLLQPHCIIDLDCWVSFPQSPVATIQATHITAYITITHVSVSVSVK